MINKKRMLRSVKSIVRPYKVCPKKFQPPMEDLKDSSLPNKKISKT